MAFCYRHDDDCDDNCDDDGDCDQSETETLYVSKCKQVAGVKNYKTPLVMMKIIVTNGYQSVHDNNPCITLLSGHKRIGSTDDGETQFFLIVLT